MAFNPAVVAVLAAGLGAAACIDMKTRRVPNALTFTLALTGVGCAIAGVSGLSVKASLIGFAVGLALMLPGYLIGATGAGDVKLLAAAGTLMGPANVGIAFLYTALAGGVLALLVAQRRRRLSITLERAGRLVASRAANVGEIEHPSANNRFAYAPAIAVGSLLAAFGI